MADSAGGVVGDINATRGKEKRFGCSFCSRLFARKEHADRHERTHTQEKPFRCPQCESRFTRSDLLVRHERLTHKKEPVDSHEDTDQSGSRKRRRTHTSLSQASSVTSPANNLGEISQHQVPTSVATNSPMMYRERTYPINSDRDHDFLTTLSFAAEQAALQDSLASSTNNAQNALLTSTPHYGVHPVETGPYVYSSATDNPPYPGSISGDQTAQPQDMISSEPFPDLAFGDSLDSLADFMDNGALSSYHFSSIISAEQPVPFLSPESLGFTSDRLFEDRNNFAPPKRTQSPTRFEEQSSFSRFGSRLPSLQPEERSTQYKVPRSRRKPLTDISISDREKIVEKFSVFSSVVSPSFRLPSSLALSRYLAAYIGGFHEHLPFLHIPSMNIETCSVELLLSMAAVGAQYCFEGDKGVDLFHASQAIASQRIRRRDAALSTSRHDYRSSSIGSRVSASYPSLPSLLPYSGTSGSTNVEKEDLMQTAQALLVLMAMATWAKHKDILREALAIQSILAALVREDGLRCTPLPPNASWEEWVRMETVKRTKFIIFCFFNLHCIVYNIPPLILNSELKMELPSGAAEFKAASTDEWREARTTIIKPILFEDAFGRLFSKVGKEITEWNTSLGNYILINAIIQHVFFVRQTAKCRYNSAGELLPEDISALERALRNWQAGWRRNPESSLNPMDPNGPVAFNSTALLRLAYIRLNVDIGPGRALDTRDPYQIANAFRESPAIKRTPNLVRAVLHSAHALSIPVKIGIRLVAQTQTFIWSIQHSLCSLECAVLLSKWLEALSAPEPDPPPTEDEKRIVGLVKTLLDETDFAAPPGLGLESPATLKYLSAGVLRVWATIFCGAQTWAIVDVIGTSLNVYADMLDGDLHRV